ncbi:MAG: hypothetical protein HY707_03370 [Ignavibacteriae bacterium]|nr:hypothetical protein [Ignavibacteriota bacterium]
MITLPSALTTNTGCVTSDGDAQLFADVSRDRFYTDGTGITVGVISDGARDWDHNDILTCGDLPADVYILERR